MGTGSHGETTQSDIKALCSVHSNTLSNPNLAQKSFLGSSHRSAAVILISVDNSPQDERPQYTPQPSLPVHPSPVILSIPNMLCAGLLFTFLFQMVPSPIAHFLLHSSSLHPTPDSSPEVFQSPPLHPKLLQPALCAPQPHSTCLMMYSLVTEYFLTLDLHMGRSCHGAKIQMKPRGIQTSTVCWKHTGRSASGRARKESFWGQQGQTAKSLGWLDSHLAHSTRASIPVDPPTLFYPIACSSSTLTFLAEHLSVHPRSQVMPPYPSICLNLGGPSHKHPLLHPSWLQQLDPNHSFPKRSVQGVPCSQLDCRSKTGQGSLRELSFTWLSHRYHPGRAHCSVCGSPGEILNLS